MQEQLKVGQYILERRIGEGGMAEVWEARHVHLGTTAAIKFLLPRLAGDPELEDRFLDEGKRQARLQHPNIVSAIDFVQQDGRSYLIMQYVEGDSLETKLRDRQGPLTLDEVHAISWDVLSALDYAHSLGVVHRDVKPSNILLDHNGRVWLSDFGIALALREERRVTRTGTAVGTPDYMSPEQIVRPREVDARSDIYSFGCVLYAMLTGGPPFGMEGATEFYIKDCHVRTPPPPLVYLNPDIPAAIGEVAFRCLEKDPAKRFPTCGAVMIALEAAISGEQKAPEEKPPDPPPPPLPPVPDPTPARGLKKYALVGAAAILLISGAAYLWIAPNAHRKKLLETRDWTHAIWNDSDFSDCMAVPACLARKSQAENLHAIQWRQLPYNSPLFDDCMGYPDCTLQKAHRDKLIATSDWLHADKGLLSDCMGYQPCLQGGQHTKDKVPQPKGQTLDPENLPTCCAKSSDPAACRAIKRREQIPDCSSPMEQRLMPPTVPPQN